MAFRRKMSRRRSRRQFSRTASTYHRKNRQSGSTVKRGGGRL